MHQLRAAVPGLRVYHPGRIESFYCSPWYTVLYSPNVSLAHRASRHPELIPQHSHHLPHVLTINARHPRYSTVCDNEWYATPEIMPTGRILPGGTYGYKSYGQTVTTEIHKIQLDVNIRNSLTTLRLR